MLRMLKMPRCEDGSISALLSFVKRVQASSLASSGKQRQLEDALDHLEHDIEVDSYAALVRRCGNARALSEGKSLHARIIRGGYTRNVYLGNLLVQMYAKCSSLQNARAVFNGIKLKNLFSWNIMITAYAQNGHPVEALELYRRMDVEPNGITFTSALVACSALGALNEGEEIHARIKASRIVATVILETAIVNMYAKCGRLEIARGVFDGIRHKNVVSWNTMIAAYTHQGHIKEALDLFESMKSEGLQPDKVTFASVLGACSDLRVLSKVHASIVARGLQSGVVVATALVNMYAKCGSLQNARQVFDEMKERNVVSWNAMITAYAQHGHSEKAIELYREMDLEGVSPDNTTFGIVLGACCSLGALAEGKLIHSDFINRGLQLAVLVETALVNMYAKCGRLDDAKKIFEKMQRRDVVAWNSMIGACSQHGQGKEAIEVYKRMSEESGVEPNVTTFTSVLSACSNMGALEEGKEIHASIDASNLQAEVSVQNALLNMYAKCGSIDFARSVLDKMAEKDEISMNVMIAAYAQQGQGAEAIHLFRQMELEGIEPDDTTFASIVTACSSVGALEVGKKIHARFITNGLQPNVVVETALVNMYGKCGTLEDARSVFDSMQQKNAVSWNAMLAACAHQGHGDEAVELSREASCDGIELDGTSYISLLIACSHAGLLDKAYEHFMSMVSDHGVDPMVEHYRCMIDILGRAGRLVDAEDLMRHMPFQPDAVAWRTFLGACRTHGNVEHAARAAEQAFDLDRENTAPYVLLSNIYAAAGRKDELVEVRSTIRDKMMKKVPGRSYIEVHNRVHEFMAGDTSHPQNEAIQAELQRLNADMKQAGYVASTNEVLHDVREEEKEHMLCLHSEKLAIAFGLVATSSGSPLRIVKNLRVCSDCHAAIKLISKLAGRRISVRDAHRFHQFQHGTCSCGDYW